MESTGTAFIHLECSKCGTEYSRNKIYNLSPCCSLPLFPIYDLDKAHNSFNKNDDSSVFRPPQISVVVLKNPGSFFRGPQNRENIKYHPTTYNDLKSDYHRLESSGALPGRRKLSRNKLPTTY